MKTTILLILALIAINANTAVTNVGDEEFYLEEEEFVNDIPFSTSKVVAECKMKEAMNVEFTMKEETSVNDLPFDTKSVVQNLKNSVNTTDKAEITTEENNSTQTNNSDVIQVQSSSSISKYIIGILVIIFMSAYTLTAFLL